MRAAAALKRSVLSVVSCDIESARIYGLLPVPPELSSRNAFEQAELVLQAIAMVSYGEKCSPLGASLMHDDPEKARRGSALCPAGSLVLLLVCVYYASLVFLFGGEFATVYAQSHESRAARK